MAGRTETDPNAHEWAINDQVIRLRRWGTGVVYPLPDAGEESTLGSSATCSLQIHDPAGQISSVHAGLALTAKGWSVRDLGSKNGLHLDGVRHPVGALEPGTELGLGNIVLIAESAQLIALQGFLARLLGWGEDRRQDVDRALRSVRLAATHRGTLVLSGDGELASIAQSLHARTLGRGKPFILCDPRRRRSKEDVRNVANYDEPGAAVRAALGGTLCFVRRRLPSDATTVLDELRSPRPRVQLIVCVQGEERSQIDSFLTDPMIIPPLAERTDELDRIISEYAREATVEFGVTRSVFTDEDHDWVRAHSAGSLPDIHKATRRVVALHASRTPSEAARRLGMAAVSLSRWFGRRGFGIRDPPICP
jgi:hypothetical protein